MSRRKHLLQSLEQEVEPPGEGQHIVRALGSRGSNIIEVRACGCSLGMRPRPRRWKHQLVYRALIGCPSPAPTAPQPPHAALACHGTPRCSLRHCASTF